MKRCDANEQDGRGFAAAWADEDSKVLKRIAKAKAVLPKVETPESILEDMATLCKAVGADGLRGELTLMRGSRALAALDGKKVVTRKHLKEIAPLALRHRLRRNVLDETGSTTRIERALEELFGWSSRTRNWRFIFS
jgi:magnesium chelatase subunit I